MHVHDELDDAPAAQQSFILSELSFFFRFLPVLVITRLLT